MTDRNTRPEARPDNAYAARYPWLNIHDMTKSTFSFLKALANRNAFIEYVIWQE